jgi:hypothetical protein
MGALVWRMRGIMALQTPYDTAEASVCCDRAASCLMNESYILQMRDPWSLMYGEYEQDFIDALREKIGPKHPLYNQEVYAIAVRRNPGAVLYQAFNDGFYAIVYFSSVPKGRRGMPKTEIFADQQAVGEKIAADHAEQLEQYKRDRAV